MKIKYLNKKLLVNYLAIKKLDSAMKTEKKTKVTS